MPTINPAKAISVAGLTCGVMDISAALIVYGLMGSKPLRLLQGIAGGILGPRTFSGGISTALLGLTLHFVIAFGAATVFFFASRVMPFLLNQAVLSGVLYGIAVYFFMNRVVVQLSAATKFPFSIKMMLIGVIIHIFCVGLPISLTVRRFAR
jgi:phage shock protein PspC (stress-responsive transcriptional regulator)